MVKKRDWGLLTRREKRLAAEFYPTPVWVTRILLRNFTFQGKIWECACGDGKMSEVLKTKYDVISTDLYDRGYGKSGVNYLTQIETLAPNIVTNPPYVIATKWAWRTMELDFEHAALLCRMSFLEGKERFFLFNEYPPRKIVLISDRVKIGSEKPGGQWTLAWYIWEKGYTGKTEFCWDSYFAPDPRQMTIKDLGV